MDKQITEVLSDELMANMDYLKELDPTTDEYAKTIDKIERIKKMIDVDAKTEADIKIKKLDVVSTSVVVGGGVVSTGLIVFAERVAIISRTAIDVVHKFVRMIH